MEISTGVTLPDATLLMKDADGIHSVSLADKMKGRKVIIFAVPGAFTPTCSSAHVPSFIRTKDAFAAKGVDEIICISVNDPHVMHAWGEATGAIEALSGRMSQHARLLVNIPRKWPGYIAGRIPNTRQMAPFQSEEEAQKASLVGAAMLGE